MSNNCTDSDSPVSALKSEAARQRWEMFHRAIAHAKQSNFAAMQDSESPRTEPKQAGPLLSVIR